MPKLAYALIIVAFLGCAGGSTLEAHLAVDPDRLSIGEPQFAGCDDCRTVRYQMPAGAFKSVTIAPEPVYGLKSRDIEKLEIYERRSPHILGAQSLVVIAPPSESWLSSTETVRDSYPHDSVAWLHEDRLLVVTFNVNSHAQGAFWVAVFSCEREALAFASRMRHPTAVIPQPDEDYQAEVEELNARNADILEKVRVDPESFSQYPDVSTADVERLLSASLPQFPVSPEAYYGPGHELPECE